MWTGLLALLIKFAGVLGQLGPLFSFVKPLVTKIRSMKLTNSRLLLYISLFFGLVSIFLFLRGFKLSGDIRKYQNILHDKTSIYEDELGRSVKEVSSWRVKVKELKYLSEVDSLKLSDYEKKIVKVYEELKITKHKVKKVEAALMFKERSIDEFVVGLSNVVTDDTIVQTVPLKTGSYSDEWSTQDYVYDPNTDSLKVSRTIENEFYIDMFKERLRKPNGKKYLWPVRLFKPWDYKASIKSLKDSTLIRDFVVINIAKR